MYIYVDVHFSKIDPCGVLLTSRHCFLMLFLYYIMY